jgi:hypothetical protein
MLSDQLREIIRARIAEGESLEQIARDAKVPHYLVLRFMKKENDIQMPTVVRLAYVLGLSLAPDPEAPLPPRRRHRKQRRDHKIALNPKSSMLRVDQQLRAAVIAALAKGESPYALSLRLRVEFVSFLRLMKYKGDVRLASADLMAQGLGLMFVPREKVAKYEERHAKRVAEDQAAYEKLMAERAAIMQSKKPKVRKPPKTKWDWEPVRDEFLRER